MQGGQGSFIGRFCVVSVICKDICVILRRCLHCILSLLLVPAAELLIFWLGKLITDCINWMEVHPVFHTQRCTDYSLY
jgi:hypothetical protein